MNTDPLAVLWNSPLNRPHGDAGDRLAAQFVVRLQRRRRFHVWWLGWTFLALTIVTVMAGFHMARHGAVAVTGLPALLPLLGLPWLAAIYFWRKFNREPTGASLANLPVRAALTAASAANRSEIGKLRVVGFLLVLTMPLSGWAVWNLHVGGKATENQAWSMAAVFGLALTSGLVGVALRHRVLRSERAVIHARLAECDSVHGS